MSNKKIGYVDMDGVLVDFESSFKHINPLILTEFEGRKDEIPHIFSLMQPMPNAIESFKELSKHIDLYILSTAPYKNATAWHDKVEWVKLHLGDVAEKRLILSHQKHLNRGDFLIDDRTANGADRFQGELILFGSDQFKDWNVIKNYVIENFSNIELNSNTSLKTSTNNLKKLK